MSVRAELRWLRRRARRLGRGWSGLALWALAVAGGAVHLGAFALLGSAAWHARLQSPGPTLLVTDRDGRFLGELASGPRRDEAGAESDLGYWPLEGELPARVVAATIALEDRRFRLHPGVDPVAIARAVRQNWRTGRRVSGASTLAMQVARLQNPGARGYWRKCHEALTAWLLTQRYGRERILRHYLQIVPYGNRIHGIAYAARRYLDKPVVDLSWAEIAFLAALPQSPTRSNPYQAQGRARAIARGERLLGELHDGGVLTADEFALAAAQIRGIEIPWLERRPPEALHALLRLERELRSAAAAAAGAPGLRDLPLVRTTLDLDLQRESVWATQRALREWSSRGAGNAALIVVDVADRSGVSPIRAWVGSGDYFDSEHSGALDYTQVERSAGSTLKPFLYALALDRGLITPATVLDDLRRGAGGVANADDRFLGPMLPRAALANSRNVPAVDLLARMGLRSVHGFFGELGLHRNAEPAETYGLGLAIGGLPISLEQLTLAYTALAGDGALRPLRWLADGEPAPPAPRVLSETAVRQIALFLSDPQARLPSFPRLGASEYPFPVAVKTGTSSGFHDAWAVAYSSRYLVAAWVGNPDFRPMQRLSGYRSAAELVQRVLLRLHPGEQDGLADLGFPPPRGHTTRRVCALSGALATPACDRVFVEWFAPGAEPEHDCTAHRPRLVDRRDGRLATAATPAEHREMRTFVELPARYAEWLTATAQPLAPMEASSLDAGATGSAPSLGGALAAAGGGPRLQVVSPENGATLLWDPETPPSLATLALQAIVEPAAAQVVWYVDGKPYEVAAHPYAARWPLARGLHTFQVRLAYSSLASSAVRVVVQ